MISCGEAVGKINSLIGSDFDPTIWSKYWNYPDEQFYKSPYKAKQAVNKLLRYFGDLAEEYLSGRGQYEVRIFIDNWAFKFLIADLIDASTIVIFSIYKTDKTLEEWEEER